MHDETMIFVALAPALIGMVTMVICGSIAKSWLARTTGYDASRVAMALLGPLLTSFGPVATYARERKLRGQPTTVATVFYVATAVWGLGLLAFFAWLATAVH